MYSIHCLNESQYVAAGMEHMQRWPTSHHVIIRLIRASCWWSHWITLGGVRQVPRYSSILRIYRYTNDLGDKPTVTAAAVLSVAQRQFVSRIKQMSIIKVSCPTNSIKISQDIAQKGSMSLQLPESPLPPLKSFSLTHILYDPSHPLSIPLTLLSLSPIFLFVSYFTLLIFTRRISIAFLASGQLANEVLSWVLKRIFKGERPYIGHGEVGTGYGMPSSHSQAAGFLAAWGIGYALTHEDRNEQVRSVRAEKVRKWRTRVYVFALLLWSVGVSYSR